MNILRILPLIAGLGLSATLIAQPDAGTAPREGGRGGGPAGRHGRHPGHPIVRVLDTDKNGVISAAELDGASAAILALDANADGTVSAAEFRPARPAGAPPPPRAEDSRNDADRPARPADPVMLALDANHDHKLSASEIANATSSLKVLDADADGQLTRDELRPLPPEKN